MPKINKVYTWKRVPRLPSEYQEVEYIQSSGSAGTGQFIRTGYKANQNTAVEMSASANSVSSDTNACFYCSRTGSTTATFTCSRIGNKLRHDYNTTQQSNVYTISANTIYKIYANKNLFYVNDTLVDTRTAGTFSSSYAMLLLASNNGGDSTNIDNCFNGKLYYCKIWDNDVLVRDFVPCYRKSDSVIGMYDLVNDQFYTNAGSGTFTKGSDVNTNTAYKEFLIRPISKEWKPNANTIFYLPFTDDILDHSGNNRTLTANGSNYTFTTRSNGAKCMSLNNGGGTTYFSFSDAACKRSYSNQSRTWAYKISDAVLQGSSRGECSIFGYNGSMKVCTLNQATASGYNQNQLKLPGVRDLSGSSNTGTSYDSTDVRATGTTEHSIVFTFDATTKTFLRYRDGVLIAKNVFTAGPSQSASYCYICRDGYATDAGRYLRAKISHIVYEEGVRDEQRIQQYGEML